MTELLDFTRRALAADIERHRIAAALAQAGWPEARIKSSLSHFSATTDFPIPVPVPPPRFSAREAFVYLLLFSAMALVIWHLVGLGFEIVDYLLPDPGNPMPGSPVYIGAARWDMSVLICCFPIFAFLFFATNRRSADSKYRKLSLARYWLTYLALFSAAVALIGDVILLVSDVIAGGLTTGLFVKAAFVALVVGGVLVFYLGLMLGEEYE